MKLHDLLTNETPTILPRNGMKLRKINLSHTKHYSRYIIGKKTGNINLFRKDTTIEFPDTIEDVTLTAVQMSPNSTATDTRLLVKVNNSLFWLSLRHLVDVYRANSRARKCIFKRYPLMEALLQCTDNFERVTMLLGKTIVVDKIRKYKCYMPVFKNGEVIRYEYQRTTIALLREVRK